MAVVYDTTGALLPGIKSRAFVPTSQSTFNTTDICRIATEEMHSALVPLLLGVREEFFVTTQDTSLVAGQASYSIPTRALGADLRDVQLYFTDGSTQRLARLEPEQLTGLSPNPGRPVGYILQGNSVVLYPTPATGTTDKLRLTYHQRPNALVPTANAAVVASVTSTTVTAVSSLPGTFGASGTFDIINAKPPFDCRGVDLSATIVGQVLTISAGVPSGVVAGDYICLAGESPVPQLPVELHPLLQCRTAATMLQAVGDTEGASQLRKEIEEKRHNALVMIANRVKGATRKMANGMARWRGPGSFGRW
jgi:hypothetical protein